MARKLAWPDTKRERFRKAWVAGMPVRKIAERFDLGYESTIARARYMGLPGRVQDRALPPAEPQRAPNSLPMPPGDPVSWGAITVGTILEGAAYG